MRQPPVLEIENLTVSYQRGKQWLDAVRDVSFSIEAGQTYGLVGESGSGKSTLALAVMGYLPDNGTVRGGSIRLGDIDLLSLNREQMRNVWRDQIKMVPQNPLSSLNPSLRISDQLQESMDPDISKTDREARVITLLDMVHLSDPERVAQSYPHQLSGGMQQRVLIAMSLSVDPALLVLDEPTTNLDVTTEAAILDLFSDLISKRSTAVLYVSHDLSVVSGFSDRVAVLYAGELVEDISVAALLQSPLHPYTQGLLNSVPRPGQSKRSSRLMPIPGNIPHLDDLPPGCAFAPRCSLAVKQCQEERPPAEQVSDDHRIRCFRWQELLEGTISLHPEVTPADTVAPYVDSDEPALGVRDLYQSFAGSRTLKQWLRREKAVEVKAVDGIDISIDAGTTLGLVGESGSGKTTLARSISGLLTRSQGDVRLLDQELPPKLSQRDRDLLKRLQMVFQNPEDALNPYRTVGQSLQRPLMRLKGLSASEAEGEVALLLEAVQLHPSYADRLPSQLSGGEKQRVAIARAFSTEPDLLIFDESVSALDVSVQASILNMLNRLQGQQGSAYLFISHDLAVVGYLADTVAVMYLGQIVEFGPTEALFKPPLHPYTEALLSAVPRLDPQYHTESIHLQGDIPSPRDLPSGCRFHTRCPRLLGDICRHEAPPWQEGVAGHSVRCHIDLAELATMQKPTDFVADVKETDLG